MMRWPSLEVLLALATVITLAIPGAARAQACHHGVVEDGVIRWRTTLAQAGSLVGPLPADVSVESIEGGVARLEGGRLAGVSAEGPGPIVLVTRQAIGDAEEVVLRPPLVSAPQRIMLTAREGGRTSFAPALDGPVERHVGYHASPEIDGGTRAWLDGWCGPRERSVATYVRDVGYDDLRGAVVRDTERRGSLLWIGWLVLGLGAVGGVVAWRRLAARAAIERADVVIEERFRSLERQGPPR